MRFTLDVLALYSPQSFGIEVYLYTKGNIIMPLETSGLYGIKYMKYYPKPNSTYFERFFVYKNTIKRLESTTLGCRNYDKEDSIGQCIVKFVEDTYNCTTYQIFADKSRDPCNRTSVSHSKRDHIKLSSLSEYGIYNRTKCLPHCKHDTVQKTGLVISTNENGVIRWGMNCTWIDWNLGIFPSPNLPWKFKNHLSYLVIVF